MAYNIPRNTKGEGRILYIFSTKALLYTFVGLIIGSVFYFIFNFIGLQIVGIVICAIFGVIGFIIATFKIPSIRGVEATKSTGGEQIDEIIKRAIKFKMKKTKKYVLYNTVPKENTKEEK